MVGHGPHVALWRQRVAGGDDPVLWDYHVLVLARGAGGEGEWEAWDLDTTLPCPVPARTWIAETFRPGRVSPPLEPRFRLVSAETYLECFSSDRAHMVGEDGQPLSPFPAWPPILAADGRSNLARFRDFDDPFVGERLDLAGLALRLEVAPRLAMEEVCPLAEGGGGR